MTKEEEQLIATLRITDDLLSAAEAVAKTPEISPQMHGVILQLRMALRLMPEVVGDSEREQAMYHGLASWLAEYRQARG